MTAHRVRLGPDGEYGRRGRAVKHSDVQRCPRHSLTPRHYWPDGTCKCGQYEVLERRFAHLRRKATLSNPDVGEAVAQQAVVLGEMARIAEKHGAGRR